MQLDKPTFVVSFKVFTIFESDPGINSAFVPELSAVLSKARFNNAFKPKLIFNNLNLFFC